MGACEGKASNKIRILVKRAYTASMDIKREDTLKRISTEGSLSSQKDT